MLGYLLVIFSIISLHGNLYAKERQGADLRVQKTDGQQLKGELIAVKQNSLLLKEHNSGADVTAVVSEIKTITIVKKSKALGYGITGFILGWLVGYLIFEQLRNDETQSSAARAALWGVVLAIPFGLGGAINGIDEVIKLEGKSDSEVKEILGDLRKKARVPDFQ